MDTAPKINPLDKLHELIERGHIQETIEFNGSTYRVRSLNDEEYCWRDQFVNYAQGALSIFMAQRAPTLAIAITHIDGVPVASIPDLQLNEEESRLRDQTGGGDTKFVAAHKLLKLLSTLPRDYVEGLYDLYFERVEKVAKGKVTDVEVKKS